MCVMSVGMLALAAISTDFFYLFYLTDGALMRVHFINLGDDK